MPKHMRFVIITTTLLVFGSMLVSIGVHAATQLVAQGYTSTSPLQPGMIVRLDPSHTGQVEALDLSHVKQMLGVVVLGSSAPLTISSSTLSANAQQVYVSNTGEHQVLVTTQNGPIAPGDYITVSSLSGLGMLANSNESMVLGQAVSGFNGSSGVIDTSTLTGSGGRKQTVAIGSIPVDINIKSNPLVQVATKGVPVVLSQLTHFATNKSVSADRVYLGLACVAAGLIIAVTILYAAIKNGFISIGRNPLVKRTIIISLLRVVVIAIIIFIASLAAAYFIISQ
ncbi:hypothetical protein M1512_02685 [Patescibacteria group bacterium]|nr:hypothetical protein [Patescibacteria group bacterium]